MTEFQNLKHVHGYNRKLLIDLNRFTYTHLKEEIGEINPIPYSERIEHPFHYLSPSLITNNLLEFDVKNLLFSSSMLKLIFEYLDLLLCKYIVIRLIRNIEGDDLKQILELIQKHNVHELTLLLNYSDPLYSDTFGEMILKAKRLKQVVIFESPFDKNLNDILFYTKSSFQFSLRKDKNEFFVNHDLFSEAQNHHTYFNRKLYIGPIGEIKNAPECEEVYGYIQDLKEVNDLLKIISSLDFQKYWFVKKDDTDVCRDCEFRYICVDNRVPQKRFENEWFHTQECNYNPYIAKWKGEEGYNTLENCGVKSNETGLHLDYHRIAEINETIL